MTALLNAVGQLYFFSFIMVLHTLLQQYSCHSGFKTTNVELKPSWQLYCFSRVLAPWFRRKRSWPTAVVVQSFRFPALLLANFFSCGHILIFSLISLNKILSLGSDTDNTTFSNSIPIPIPPMGPTSIPIPIPGSCWCSIPIPILGRSDIQYQYQYQYLEIWIFNTNTNTNTGQKLNTSIPIPILTVDVTK